MFFLKSIQTQPNCLIVQGVNDYLKASLNIVWVKKYGLKIKSKSGKFREKGIVKGEIEDTLFRGKKGGKFSQIKMFNLNF